MNNQEIDKKKFIENQINDYENALLYVTNDSYEEIEKFFNERNAPYINITDYVEKAYNIYGEELVDTSFDFNQDVFKYKFMVRTMDDEGNFIKEGVQLTDCATKEVIYYPDFETFMDEFELAGKKFYGKRRDTNVIQNKIIAPIINPHTYCHTIYEWLERFLWRSGAGDIMFYKKGRGIDTFDKFGREIFSNDGDVIIYKGKTYLITSVRRIDGEYDYEFDEIEIFRDNNFLIYENDQPVDAILETDRLEENFVCNPKAGFKSAWEMLTEFKFDDGTTLLDNFHLLKFIVDNDNGFMYRSVPYLDDNK